MARRSLELVVCLIIKVDAEWHGVLHKTFTALSLNSGVPANLCCEGVRGISDAVDPMLRYLLVSELQKRNDFSCSQT